MGKNHDYLDGVCTYFRDSTAISTAELCLDWLEDIRRLKFPSLSRTIVQRCHIKNQEVLDLERRVASHFIFTRFFFLIFSLSFFSLLLILSVCSPKLYIPSTLNIALLQWHTHLNVCAVK